MRDVVCASLAAALRILWASPCSLLGALLALPIVATGGSVRRVGHTIEVALRASDRECGGLARRLPFCAITFGHVILGVSPAALSAWRVHERVHVRQYERLGLLLLVAYPASSVVAWLRGNDPYRDNRFEAQAFREAADGRGEA